MESRTSSSPIILDYGRREPRRLDPRVLPAGLALCATLLSAYLAVAFPAAMAELVLVENPQFVSPVPTCGSAYADAVMRIEDCWWLWYTALGCGLSAGLLARRWFIWCCLPPVLAYVVCSAFATIR